MKFEIIEKTYRINRIRLEKVAQAAFSVLGEEKDGHIELIFVSRDKIQKLNRDYRKIDEITDILSFTLEHQPLIGQMFICYTKAREQSIERNIELDKEIERLLIHGLAHLYGYDHQTRTEQNDMEKVEKLILERTES
ncbi:MAG: rRNA maturation RNase YbeY [Patescibacteria group bacterium]|nr:rRNA maturation RNase YbeY [Patescibacteria group bacterium]